MRRITRILTGVAAVGIGLLLAAPAASASPVSPPGAKRVEIQLDTANLAGAAATTDPLVIEPIVHPNHPKVSGTSITMSPSGPFIQATAFRDAYHKGGQVQQLVAKYGACDSTGYKWSLLALNRDGIYPAYAWELVSSFANTRGIGSGCNRVTVTTGRKFVSPARSWTSCIGAHTLDTEGWPYNDNTLYYAVRKDPNCPSVG